MRRNLRKRQGVVEVAAVMEVAQVVAGGRTRERRLALAAASAQKASAAKARGVSGMKRRRAAAVAEVESGGKAVEISYLELRSRRLVMRFTANSGCARRRASSMLGGEASRHSSDASSEVVGVGSRRLGCELAEVGEGSDACFSECSGDMRETTPSSGLRPEESDGVESTMGRETTRSTAESTPSQDEIEEFFSAAELIQQQRFTMKYNYDVVDDVPLAGRYEWSRVDP